MEVNYRIDYDEKVVHQDIPALSQDKKIIIKKQIEKKLVSHPEVFGKPLRDSLFGYRSLRVGDYRVIFRIILPTQVKIIVIQPRSKVYGTLHHRLGLHFL